jgi:hypothetical protein
MVSPAALDAASEFIKDFGIGFCGGLREVIEIARRQVSSRTMRGNRAGSRPAGFSCAAFVHRDMQK